MSTENDNPINVLPMFMYYALTDLYTYNSSVYNLYFRIINEQQ